MSVDMCNYACSIDFSLIFKLLTLDGALLKFLSPMPLLEVPELRKSFWNSGKTDEYVSRLIYLFTLFKAKRSASESGFNGIYWNVMHIKQTTKSMSMWNM